MSYRRSYFADPVKRESRSNPSEGADALAYASQYGAPTSQEIPFIARLETGEAREANPEERNQLAAFRPAEQKTSRSSGDSATALLVRNYQIHYSVVPGLVEMGSTEKGRSVKLEFAVTAYDHEGHIVCGVRATI